MGCCLGGGFECCAAEEGTDDGSIALFVAKVGKGWFGCDSLLDAVPAPADSAKALARAARVAGPSWCAPFAAAALAFACMAALAFACITALAFACIAAAAVSAVVGLGAEACAATRAAFSSSLRTLFLSSSAAMAARAAPSPISPGWIPLAALTDDDTCVEPGATPA